MAKVKIDKDAKLVPVNTEKLNRLGKKYNFTFNKDELLEKFKNGDVVFIRQKEDGKQIIYVFWEIYIKEITTRYSAHKDIKEGKELLISNFKLPNIKPL